MLTCRDITELVTDYAEGRMSLWTRMRFRMHVGMCRHCRAYLQQLKTTVRLTGAIPPEPMPAEVRDELLARFRDWKATAPSADEAVAPDGEPTPKPS